MVAVLKSKKITRKEILEDVVQLAILEVAYKSLYPGGKGSSSMSQRLYRGIQGYLPLSVGK